MTALNADAPITLRLPLLSRILKSQLVRRVGLLTAGVGVGHAIALLAAPLLTRLFDPASFGLYGLFVAVASLFLNGAALRYDLGVVLARSASMASALWFLCLFVALALAFAVLVGVAGAGEAISRIVDAPGLDALLYWVPLQIVVTGLFLATSQWATRQRAYSSIAQYHVVRASAMTLAQLGAGCLALGAKGLVLGYVAGNAISTLLLVWRAVSRDWPRMTRGFTRHRILAAGRSFRRLPQFSAPQEFVNAASHQLPFLIIGAFFGPAVVGLYWLSARVLAVPGNFVNQAVRQVYLQHLSELHHRGESIFAPVLRAALTLWGSGGAILLPVIAFGPWLFSLVFGPDWIEAGYYARWTAIATLAGLTNSLSWCGVHVLGLQKSFLAWELTTSIARNAVLVLLALTGDPLLAVAGHAGTVAALNVALVCFVLNRSSRRDPS